MPNTKILASEIQAKWTKLNSLRLTHVKKSHDALSALVLKAYSLDKAKADADVTAWMAAVASNSKPTRRLQQDLSRAAHWAASNEYPLHLVSSSSAYHTLHRPRASVVRHASSGFECPAVFEIRRNAGRAKYVVADLRRDLGRPRAAGYR